MPSKGKNGKPVRGNDKPVRIVKADNAADSSAHLTTNQTVEVTQKRRQQSDQTAMETKQRKPPGFVTLGQEYVEPGDNARYLRYARVAFDLPPIDIADEKQVEQRIGQYFDFCAENDRKPSLVGVANWIGIDRTTLNSWKRGEYRTGTHSPLIQKVIGMLEEMWVDYMQNGKLNPASGIFLGKNFFGYKDVQDVVVTPQNPLGDAEGQKALEDKYLDVVDVGDD